MLLAVALTVRATAARARSCSTWPTAAAPPTATRTEPVDPTRCRWPDPTEWTAACARSPLVAAAPASPAGRCGWSAACSSSTATGGRRSRSRRAARRAASPARRPIDPAALRAGLDRLFPATGGERAARWPRRSARCAGQRPGRRPGHRQDHHRRPAARRCCASSPAGPPRIALAAPTGKAAARLEEAVARASTADAAARPTARGSATLHGVDPAPAARLAARRAQPVPARPRQPAAVRRRRRRRDARWCR